MNFFDLDFITRLGLGLGVVFGVTAWFRVKALKSELDLQKSVLEKMQNRLDIMEIDIHLLIQETKLFESSDKDLLNIGSNYEK